MAEPVVKKRETEEIKPFIQSANSGQWAKLTEAVSQEQETELVKPVSNTAKPNQMAGEKERETINDLKPLHETVIQDQTAEAGANERLKPMNPEYIAVIVRSQDAKLTYFKIKRDSMMKKLLVSYCKKFSVYYPSARFLIDGDHFNHNKTPDELELEDETEIEVMVETIGGGEQSFAWISAT